MSIEISYTNGQRAEYPTLQAALDHVTDDYPDAVFYSYDGWEILFEDEAALESLMTPDVGRILAWRTAEEAENDDGARAIAGLYWIED